MKQGRTRSFSPGRALRDNLAYFGSGRWLRTTHPVPSRECKVPLDFFGIGVAGHPDPAGDDFIIDRLNELGLRRVRLDFTYTSPGTFQERLLQRLLAASFRVCLHLMPPREEARRLSSHNPEYRAGAEVRWHAFVADILDRYETRIGPVEIGSTPNRRKWSGFTPAGYLRCWQIACAARTIRSARLFAPNVTDFEPVYNLALLGHMRRQGLLPESHTDNLFVERATEPEAFDHKILGPGLAGLLQFNVIRKAQLLQDIGRWLGVPELICTQVSWSLRRIARQLEAVEEKQADYVARYCLLAAASGALRRVYWGPLIGQREGLIDDGTNEFPEIPHVTFYGQARGRLADYRIRPAFHALQTVNRLIAGTTFRRQIPSGPGLVILEFTAADRLIHAIWTRNGRRALARDCYAPEILSRAQVCAHSGQPLAQVPTTFSESPLYLSWQLEGAWSVVRSQLPGSRQKPTPVPGVQFAPGCEYASFDHSDWRGFYLTQDAGVAIEEKMLRALIPGDASRREIGNPQAKIENNPTILRDSRNRVWSVPAPWNPSRALVIKQFRPRGFWRRRLDCGKPGKARRSWNTAQELIRRGLRTPQPIAFLEPAAAPADGAGFYICRDFQPDWSAREALTAFSRGQTEFQGHPPRQIYEALAQFLIRLHSRGVYFRDLSAGNVLGRQKPDGALELALIDTARARFYPRALGLRRRLSDLMRLCHPLNWAGRQTLAGLYLDAIGLTFRWWLKIPFHYYDWKHRIKNGFKRLGRAE